jgi:hypothetical protein
MGIRWLGAGGLVPEVDKSRCVLQSRPRREDLANKNTGHPVKLEFQINKKNV